MDWVRMIMMMVLTPPTTPHLCCAEPKYLDVTDTPPIKMSGEEIARGSGEVKGTFRAQGQTVPSDLVVYLEPKDAAMRFEVPTKHARVSQKGAQFSPALTVISA